MRKLLSTIERFKGILLLALMMSMPLLVTNIYYLHLLNYSLIAIILVIGLNLLSGYAGQISIGHAAFYGMGAYFSAVMTVTYKQSFWLALPLSGLFTAAVGFVVGKATLKLKGAYLAVASIGIGVITQMVMTNWTAVTMGAQGFKGIKYPVLLGMRINTDAEYYYLLAVIVAITYWAVGRLIDSEMGRALRSIREDETAAQFMGVDAGRLKVTAFVISTFLAGIAGSLLAHLEGYLSPYSFGFTQSVGFLLMALAGGLGYKLGPVIGVVVLTFAREYIRFFSDYQLVIYGLMLILIIVFMPRGISGFFSAAFAKLRKRGGE